MSYDNKGGIAIYLMELILLYSFWKKQNDTNNGLQNDINNTLQNDTNNALQRINYCVVKE
jgi:hypothetical protein